MNNNVEDNIIKEDLKESFVGLFLDFIENPSRIILLARLLKWENSDTISFSNGLCSVSNNGDFEINGNTYSLTEFSDSWKEKPQFLFEYLRHIMELSQWIQLANKGLGEIDDGR